MGLTTTAAFLALSAASLKLFDRGLQCMYVCMWPSHTPLTSNSSRGRFTGVCIYVCLLAVHRRGTKRTMVAAIGRLSDRRNRRRSVPRVHEEHAHGGEASTAGTETFRSRVEDVA